MPTPTLPTGMHIADVLALAKLLGLVAYFIFSIV